MQKMFLLAFVGVMLTSVVAESAQASFNRPQLQPRVDEGCPAVDPIWYTVMFPDPTDCSKFYMCSNGVAIPMDCPEGLHFNPKKHVCDWPENANCVLGVSSKTKTEVVKSEVIQGQTKGEDSFKRIYVQPSVDEGCPAVDPIWYTVMFPDPTDCSKFYMCSNGVAIPMDCPEGLHFNPKKHVCDWPENANCVLGVSSKSKTEVVKSEVSQGLKQNEGCPAVDPIWYTVMFPNPTDCTKFYMCSNGVAIPMDCPDGLHFNPKTHVCDWPVNANCVANVPAKSMKTEVIKSESTEKQATECPAVDQTCCAVYLPHPTDCTMFIKCSNGAEVLMHCPEGLHFRVGLNVCDWPDQANCQSSNPSASSGDLQKPSIKSRV